VINSRGWLFVFLLTAFLVMCAVNARSADSPRLPEGYTCSDVIENVKRYGYWPAILWARANGFKPEEIEAAKRCLARK
jgi:hypothetical protein